MRLCVAAVLLWCLVIGSQGTFPAGGEAVTPKDDPCHKGDTWTQDYCGSLPTVVFEQSPFKNGIYNPYCRGYKKPKPAAAAKNAHEAERLAEAISGGGKPASVKKAEAATSKAVKAVKSSKKAPKSVKVKGKGSQNSQVDHTSKMRYKFYCTSGGLPEKKEGCTAMLKGDAKGKFKGRRDSHRHHCEKKWGWVKKEIDEGRLPREEMTRQKEALKACQTYHGAEERKRRGFSGKWCEATHARRRPKGCAKKWQKTGENCNACSLGENGKIKEGRGKCLKKKHDGTAFDQKTCEYKGKKERKGAKWCSQYKSYAEELKRTKTNPTIAQLIARGEWPATVQPRKYCPTVQPPLFAKDGTKCNKQGKPQGCWHGEKGKKWQTRTPDNKPKTCMAFGQSCTAGLNYDPYSGLCANSREGWNKDKKGRDATKCGYVAAKCETHRVFYNNHRGWSVLAANKQQKQEMDRIYKHGDVERYTYSFQKWTECWAEKVDDKTWRPINFQCKVEKACTCTSCDKQPRSHHLGEDKAKTAMAKPVKCDCARLPASLEAQVNRACAQF